jgi:hypothetical protein
VLSVAKPINLGVTGMFSCLRRLQPVFFVQVVALPKPPGHLMDLGKGLADKILSVSLPERCWRCDLEVATGAASVKDPVRDRGCGNLPFCYCFSTRGRL